MDNKKETIRKRAVIYAKEITGLNRPTKSQVEHIEAFLDFFEIMDRQGLIKEEYSYGKTKKSSN